MTRGFVEASSPLRDSFAAPCELLIIKHAGPHIALWRLLFAIILNVQLHCSCKTQVGFCTRRWSNGLFKATRHRVISVTGRDRYSVPFFMDPNFDALVECLPTCCSNIAPQYPPTTAGQHLLDKYAETRQDGLDVSQQV